MEEKPKRSRLYEDEDDDDGVVEIKRPIERPRKPHYPFTFAAKLYGYNCILSEDDEESNKADPLPQGKYSELFNLVPHVRINFRVDYILQKRVGGHIVEETLCSTHRRFYIRLFLITQFDFYMHMICVPDEDEYCQVRSGLEYDIHHPETFLFKFLSCHGVNDEAVIHKWVDDTKDFVTKLKTKSFDMTGSNHRVYPIAMHIRLYTKQQENETIDDARRRAIMPDSSRVELGDKLIKLLSTPPPYKFLIQLKNDSHRMNCGTCSGKLRFQDFIFFLPCSHAYHHSCLAHWAKQKIQCQVCLEYVDFRTFLECAVFRTKDLN